MDTAVARTWPRWTTRNDKGLDPNGSGYEEDEEFKRHWDELWKKYQKQQEEKSQKQDSKSGEKKDEPTSTKANVVIIGLVPPMKRFRFRRLRRFNRKVNNAWNPNPSNGFWLNFFVFREIFFLRYHYF